MRPVILQGPVGEGRQPPREQQPVELTFQEHYGSIRSHLWFGDDMLLIGFASGAYRCSDITLEVIDL